MLKFVVGLVEKKKGLIVIEKNKLMDFYSLNLQEKKQCKNQNK